MNPNYDPNNPEEPLRPEAWSILYAEDTPSGTVFHHGPAHLSGSTLISPINIVSDGVPDSWHAIGYTHSHPNTYSHDLDDKTHGHFSKPDIDALGPWPYSKETIMYGFEINDEDNSIYGHIYGAPDSLDWLVRAPS